MKGYDNETAKILPHYEWKVVDAGMYFCYSYMYALFSKTGKKQT